MFATIIYNRREGDILPNKSVFILVCSICIFGIIETLLSQNFIGIILCFSIIAIYLLYLSFLQKKPIFLKTEKDIDELIHDLKTPATAQFRVTEHMCKGTFGKLNEEQQDIAMQLNDSSRYMLNIINNVLTLCKLKNNNIPFNFKLFEINKIIIQSIKNLKYSAEDKKCTILFDYSDEEIFLNGCELEIERVINNLLTNAVKYSDSNKIISVNSKVIKDKYEFSVISYGKYIDPKHIKKVAKEFVSLNKTGTGLGLFISNEILKKHKSKIIIKSDKEKGNYFGFILNCTPKKSLLKK